VYTGCMKTPISELNLMTETEKLYRINERLEEFHASNYDWQRVMQDKWSLAAWAQKGGN
jgi:hypothetical protein